MKEIFLRLGRTQYLSDGTAVIAETLNPLAWSPPSEVEMHESYHALVSPEKVIEVSSIPQGDSLGHTRLSSFDAAAAAGPHAHGMRGTGSDVMKIELSGTSLSAAASASRSKLAGKEKHVHAVAGYLAAKRTISGREVRNVIDRVDNGDDIIIKFKKKNGESKNIIKMGVKDEVIMIENEEYELPKAA